MQRFLIHITKWIETIICNLSWIFTICVATLSVGCISTVLYHTTHRQEWQVFMVLLLRCIVAYLVLIIMASVLVALIKPDGKSAIMSYEKVNLTCKINQIEANICGFVWFVAIGVGRKMLNGGVQVFTGDPWYTAVYSVSFRILFLYFVCKLFQFRLICEPLLKATAHKNAPGDAEKPSPLQGEETKRDRLKQPVSFLFHL